ncbi:MAG: XdhC family protein [Cyclobacteriaceae bacterium]|nr:XdhC family protein [Cyclobacteriaceae bacterium]
MKEIKSILENLKKATDQKLKTTLATVVNVHGSSYRRTGARMLILEDGHWFGSVSGGCLEGDVIERARLVMNTGEKQLFKYDTRQNAKDAFGMGYGCNGLLEILIEPISGNKSDLVYQQLLKAGYYSGAQGMATVYFTEDESVAQLGERLHTSGLSSISHGELHAALEADLSEVLQTGESKNKTFKINGRKVKVFFEVFAPNINILIFGAVFHVIPLMRIANELGFNVHVTDSFEPIQPIWNFPYADEISIIEDAAAREIIDHTPNLAIVFLTHNFFYIKDQLPLALKSYAPYVGILGSRKKTQKILREAEINELNYTPEQLSKIHYPIGLDIGANSPEEIALSIVAEIRSFFSGRSGEPLRKFEGAIHSRIIES